MHIKCDIAVLEHSVLYCIYCGKYLLCTIFLNGCECELVGIECFVFKSKCSILLFCIVFFVKNRSLCKKILPSDLLVL